MTQPAQGGPAAVAEAAESAKALSVGILPMEVRQRITLRGLLNRAAVVLGKQGWGKLVDDDTRRAVADWGLRFNVDVTTEIDVLGGNIYPNGKYWLRRLGEMVEAGLVEYAYADHINADPRLDSLGTVGADEQARRKFERVRYNVPEDATGAVVFRVKPHSMAREIVGVNWAGDSERTKIGYQGALKKGADADPIGHIEPAKTSETRAARRAMRQLCSHVPRLGQEVEQLLAAADDVSKRVKAQMDTTLAELKERPPHSQVPIPIPRDPYGHAAQLNAGAPSAPIAPVEPSAPEVPPTPRWEPAPVQEPNTVQGDSPPPAEEIEKELAEDRRLAEQEGL